MAIAIALEDITEAKQQFEALHTFDKKEALKCLADAEGSFVPESFGGDVVRLEQQGQIVYFMTDDLLKTHAVGLHDTFEWNAERISRVGFEKRTNGVYFHVGGRYGRGSYYAAGATMKVLSHLMRSLYEDAAIHTGTADASLLHETIEQYKEKALSHGGFARLVFYPADI